MTNMFKCNVCDRSYVDEATLERHIQNIHGEKLFPCDRCEQSFVRNHKLKEHIVTKHIRAINFICEICNKGFVVKGNLTVHMINMHTEERPYKCSQCSFAFKRTGDYYRHQRTHDPTKHEQCPVCMKKFKTKKSVQVCLENHSTECNEFKECTWLGCKVLLKTSQSLKDHLRRHTNKKERIKCTICSKDYADNSDLKRHTKFVHEKPEKKFVCNTCGKTFFTDKLLDRHMETHEGKILSCWYPSCLTKRSTMYDLRHHFKKQHGEVKHPKDYIPIKERPNLTCKVCGIHLKAGASPISSLKHHMEKHKDQATDLCPVKCCGQKFYYGRTGYTLPSIIRQHLQTSHSKSTSQVKIIFNCKRCDEKIISEKIEAKKQHEGWSKALIFHMQGHDTDCNDGDGHDADGKTNEGDKDPEKVKKHLAVLLKKEWRNYYQRQFEVDPENEFPNKSSDNISRLAIFQPEHVDSILENTETRSLTEEEQEKAYNDITSRIPVVFLNTFSHLDYNLE